MDPDCRTTRLDQYTWVVPVADKADGVSRSHQLAGAGGRFLAGFADLLLQLAAFAALAWLALTRRPDLFPRDAWWWAGPVAFAEWHIIYMMLFESFTRGLTPGKALVKLRVVTQAGQLPGSLAFVIRNLGRLADMALGGYLGALALISLGARRQRLGDRWARTLVIYRQPLVEQLERSSVPESLYSTSEDGYLLEAWMTREPGLDDDSRTASAVDLAAYLHQKYDPASTARRDPVAYLRQLYSAELEEEPEATASQYTPPVNSRTPTQ